MTFDENGYPDEDTLKQIETFNLGPNFENLYDFLKLVWENWEYANISWTTQEGYNLLQISTCGWSGNEEIIDAMRENHIFWAIYWYQSRRGGHYWFNLYHYSEAGLQVPVILDFVEETE